MHGSGSLHRLDRAAKIAPMACNWGNKRPLELQNRVSECVLRLYWWPLGDLNELLSELIEHLLILSQPSLCIRGFGGAGRRFTGREDNLGGLAAKLGLKRCHHGLLGLAGRLGLDGRIFNLSRWLNKLNLLRLQIKLR